MRALSGGRIKCWDIASRREFELFRGESRSINRAAFSPDDRLLAAHYDDGKVRVWDTDDWTEVASFKKNVGSLIFSSDGHIIAADGDGRISLFDVAKNEIVQEFPGNGVKAFTPDSKTLASAGWDGTTKLWNVASGQVALTLQHQGPVAGVTFSKDGMLMVTCGADGTARLWPTASLSEADAPLRAGTAEEPRTQK